MMNRFSKLSAITAFVLVTVTACGQHKQTSDQHAQTTSVSDSTAKIIVVDVRTPEEYAGDGHADCTVNYPLDQFSAHIAELKTYDKVVLVCRSGNRAGRAMQILNDAGYTAAENAGPWQNAPCATK